MSYKLKDDLSGAMSEAVMAHRMAEEVRRREREAVGGDVTSQAATERRERLTKNVKAITDLITKDADGNNRQSHEVVLDIAYTVSAIATTLWLQSGAGAPNPTVFVGMISILAEHAASLAADDKKVQGLRYFHLATNDEEPDRAN